MHLLITGAGFAGAVLARVLAEEDKRIHITIRESRPHLAGNCHTARDDKTNIMVHKYGPHIFNTSHEDVWSFVNEFADFAPFTNRVKSNTPKGIFSLPINLHTINQFYNSHHTPQEAVELFNKFSREFSKEFSREPANFEEQGIKLLGKALYYEFFHGYTKKQWGVEPSTLPASILKRLPVRFNYDDNYYSSKYQGIPKNGYTSLVESLIDHERINVELSKTVTRKDFSKFDHIFYSGPIDQLYNYKHGNLGYRTIYFDYTYGKGDLQGNPVINYPSTETKYTRVHEHKHFSYWETHESSILLTEYSKETTPEDTPYYPKRLKHDLAKLEKYYELLDKDVKVTCIGRLGTYRYLDMDVVIGESLDLANAFIESLKSGNQKIPNTSQYRSKQPNTNNADN